MEERPEFPEGESAVEEVLEGPEKKHSLDSDEEDEQAKQKKASVRKLTREDIEGEEEATIRHEGEIKITPFNLKEEMASGYFDSGGFFVANGKDAPEDDEEIHDSWLDNIDDSKIDEKVSAAHQAKMEKLMASQFGASDSEDDFDLIAFQKIILGYLEKKESVTKAIRRLAEVVKKAKRSGDTELLEDEQHRSNKLMEYVNQFVDHGHYDIYQETFESLTAKVTPILSQASSDERKRGIDDADTTKSLPNAKQVRFDTSELKKRDDFEDMFK